MAYSLETSSVKTIVPGAEVSGFCDVVARQKINEVSGEVPQLSAGEGIDISTVDGKTVITNNISAGSNISLVYDMETNTYRIDSNAGGVSSLVLTASAQPDQFVNWLAGSGYWGIQDGIEVTDSATNVGGLVVKTRTSARNYDNYFDTDASLDSDGLILSNSHGRTQRTQYNKTYLNINSSAVKYTSAVKSNPEGEPVVTSYSATWKQIIDAANGGGSISGDYIPYSAAGVYLPNSNFVLSANGRAYKLGNDVTAAITGVYNEYSEFYDFDKGYTIFNGIEYTIADNNNKTTTVHIYDEYFNEISSLDVVGTDQSFVLTGDWYQLSFHSPTQNAAQLISHQKEQIPYLLSGDSNYTGIAPIQVNNTTNEISITGESLSAGPGIDMFSSGGYVVISANVDNSTFPITGTNGTTGFTANMNCSSMMLTTGASPAGGYVKQTVRGVQYEAYPATDVSASWYNIINGANNRSNCYCIRFTNDMTAASLEDYSAYDKVTVVHSNQYTPDCMLYWDGNTKVFPSGLYCELVKGVNDQNKIDWFFTTSGWINNVEWDWD